MADAVEQSPLNETSADPAKPPAASRWLAITGAWLAGLALAALVVSIAAFFVDANTPPEPPTATFTLNGRPVSGEDAKDLLRDAGSRLIQTFTGRGDAASDDAVPAAAQAGEPVSGVLEVEARSNQSAAERTYKRFLWLFVALGLLGAAVGAIARCLGARGSAVAIALWPAWFLGALAIAAPSCAG